MFEQPQLGILLFYQYVNVYDVNASIEDIRQVCKNLRLDGRIRVSAEGFNGNLSGTWKACEAFTKQSVARVKELVGTDFKLAPCKAGETFRGLKVWESHEVCGLCAAVDDEYRDIAIRDLAKTECGQHLSPSEW